MRGFVLALALLAGATGLARADEPLPPPIDCTKDYETLYSLAYNAPDVAYVKTERVEEVWSRSRQDTYIFSREGTAAYPSIMLRSIRKTGARKWGAAMSGCGFGNQEAFQELMEDYKDINSDLLGDLKNGRPIGPP
jgi:hypothetical protein